MSIFSKLAKQAGEAAWPVRSGAGKLASAKLVDGVAELTIQSDWFTDGARLPERCTVDGEGVPPPLVWSEPPPHTRELVLICEDPDAPAPEPFVHWLVYDISAERRSLDAEGATHARQGRNSKLGSEFTPAAPPRGHGTHHYHFELFALDRPLALDEGEGRGKVLERMKGHVVGYGELVGTYERS